MNFFFFFCFFSIKGKKSQNELKDENTKLTEQLQNIKKQYNVIESDLKEMTIKFDKSQIERNALDKLHKMQSEKINRLRHAFIYLKVSFPKFLFLRVTFLVLRLN